MSYSGYSNTPYQAVNNNYSNSYSNLAQAQQRKNRRSKMIVIGSVVGLVLLVVIGVGVGVGVAKSHKNTKSAAASASNSNSNSNSSSNSGVVQQTNPDDPSSFVKDPALKQSFYGIAYTPYGSQLPNCNNSLAEVIEDIQLLSQLTTRIRLYGADCNQSALVLEAIKQTKVNMKVYLGNYPSLTDGGVAYERQRNEIQSALQTYGSSNILGITVGNEIVLDYLTDNGGANQDPNGPAGNTAAALLLPNITDTKSMLSSMNLNIPVGNSDAGSYFNNEILQAVDYGMANVHPWFADVTAENAAAWTAEFFETTNVQPAAALSNKPQMYIAETGWPTNSSTADGESNGADTATEANLQVFLDTFVCQANANGTGYFFFEYFDEVWKLIEFPGVEGYWGLFHANKTLKSVTIPDCPISS